MDDSLEERVDAVERALTDGNAADGLPDAARMEARLDDLEATVDDLDDRVAELDAAVQALRGFAGGVRAVDEAVERRANAAVARVERLEAELRSAGDSTVDDATGTDVSSGTDLSTGDRAATPGRGQEARGPPSAGDDSPPVGAEQPRTERARATGGRSTESLAETAAAAASERTDPLPTDDGDPEERSSLADRIRRLL